MREDLIDTVNKLSTRINFIVNRRWDIRSQTGFVAGLPEVQDCLHKRNDPVAAFNVTLFS